MTSNAQMKFRMAWVRMLLFSGLLALNGAAAPALPLRPAGRADPTNASIPDWARTRVPGEMAAFVGKQGLPQDWPLRPGPLGRSVAGLDHWQANNFIVYRAETAEFLAGYTPTQMVYRTGSLPAYEAAAGPYTAGLASPREKAVALLTKAMPRLMRHPTIPPCGGSVPADRGLLDEPLLQSGRGFCNEQARVFVRLCQVSGIPARLIFLFYADQRTGHVVAEFFADDHWCLADTSWFCVFPDKTGRLLSATEIHTNPEARALALNVYRERWKELLKLDDIGLHPSAGAERRQGLLKKIEAPDHFAVFGVLNYPLP